jgi:DNA-binding XRE family transcriptional regulator
MLFSWGLCRPQTPAPGYRGRGTLYYKPDISLANKTGQLDKLPTPRRTRNTEPTAEELFGRALRDLRKERAISQESLGFDSGYHPTYIGQIERGKKSPSLRAILRIAKALDTPGSEILRRVERYFSTKMKNLKGKAGYADL